MKMCDVVVTDKAGNQHKLYGAWFESGKGWGVSNLSIPIDRTNPKSGVS